MKKSSGKPIKVGVIGLGRSGWDIHVARMRDDARFNLTAVCDVQEARREEAAAAFGCDTFTDYRQLLNDGDVDLVVVASQSVDHGAQSIAALKSGRHVIVEKPMAATLAQATRMISAAEAAGKKLFVHQNYRYNADVRHIREIIAGGLLGRVFEVRIRVLGFGRRNDWQTLRKYSGGVINNTGPHFVDAALLFLESPVRRIFTDLQLTTDVGDADDHAKIILKGENGRVVDLEISTSCAFSEPKWTVLGTNGTLRSDGVTSEIKYFDPKKVRPLKLNDSLLTERRYGNDDVLPWQTVTRPSSSVASSDFYDNVYAVLKERAKMDITPQEAREVMRVTQIAHRENPPF